MNFIYIYFLELAIILYFSFSIFINISSLKSAFHLEKKENKEDNRDKVERKFRNKKVFFSNVSIFISSLFFWIPLSIYSNFKSKKISDFELSIIFPLFGITNFIFNKLEMTTYEIYKDGNVEILYFKNGLVKHFYNKKLHRELVLKYKNNPKNNTLLPAIYRRTSNLFYSTESSWYYYGEKIQKMNEKEFRQFKLQKDINEF